MFDITIIGGGPAGLSAAISAGQRGKNAAIITNDVTKSGLYRAAEIGNYPGLPGISGAELLGKLTEHAVGFAVSFFTGRATSVLSTGSAFHVGYGTEFIASKSIILATGISQTSLFPGEEELLGRGVSHCATCDGMLFRGKRVCVVCLTPESRGEADFLESIGCEVVRFETEDIRVNGGNHVTSVTADGDEIECSGVFILRRAIAPHLLIHGLEIVDGHIRAGVSGQTNIPGVFAAGDCVGTPYQIAKAVGQGQVAALSAAEYVEN